MKCTTNKCSKEAEYIIDGQSVCKDHKEEPKQEPEQVPEQKGKTKGELLAGM